MTFEQFLLDYSDRHWPGKESFLLRHVAGACIFLQPAAGGERLCSIHAVRPSSCADWLASPDKIDCQECLGRKQT